MGETFEALDQLDILPVWSKGIGVRSAPKSMFSVVLTPPKQINLVLLTPFYIDAHLHPHGIFGLLLQTEVIQDLKISFAQKKWLEELNKKWHDSHPLPPTLKIQPGFGVAMTSKKQRE
jgi:hypothetical protein